MDYLVENPHNSMAESFQSAFGNEELLFQIVDLFPIPIEIFAPDGTTMFANRAALEIWNISKAEQIVGHYNLLKDPVVNDELGMREYVRRAFLGETISVSDVKVTLEDMSERYEAKSDNFGINALYTDIHSFPIWDQNRNIAYIVNVFITTRIYEGRSDIAKAKEYIETYWLEKFDIEKIARSVNLSRYHFARLFKKHTSMTPYCYYQKIKVNKLMEAICNKNLTITEAFAVCGEDYKGNYLRLFKEKTGMTPSQYRKTVSQN
ncbi:MAG: transcriptional regulator, AraC family [Sedimentibacter sp.]|jgi:AraC-like DNA-binding protein|nr:transcriptional regulator, AraC family [Sedimentibacter sp.]